MNEATEEVVHVAIEWVDISALQLRRVLAAAEGRTRRDVEHIETGAPADDAESWGLHFRADRHFLLIALNQLCKTLDMLRHHGLADVPTFRLCPDVQRHRDIHEHWESHAPGWFDPSRERSRAGLRFAQAYPGRYPWVDSYGTSGRVRIGELEVHGIGPELDDVRSGLQELLSDR